MKKRLLALVLAVMMVLSGNAFALDLVRDLDRAGYEATLSAQGVELQLDAYTTIGAMRNGDSYYSTVETLEAQDAASLPEVGFQAYLSTAAIRQDFENLVAVAEEYLDGAIDDAAQKQDLLDQFNAFEVTGDFEIVIEASKGMNIPDEYKTVGAGVNFTTTAFTETDRIYDDTDTDNNVYTIKVEVANGLTVADLRADLENLLCDIEYKCDGVTLAELQKTYRVSVTAQGSVNIGGVCEIVFDFEPTGPMGASVITKKVSAQGGFVADLTDTTDTTTDVVENEDGSKTTTVTNQQTGETTETTEYPDGSTTVVETDKDGNVTTTTTDKDGNQTQVTETEEGKTTVTEKTDGTTGTTVETPDGESSSTVTIPEGALEGLDGPIDLPVPPVEGTGGNYIGLEVPEGVTPDSTLDVFVPAVEPDDAVVAVIKNPDGTEVVLPTIPVEDGYVVRVPGSVNFELKDNSIGFEDIEGHWAEDDINFVSARGLVNGVSEKLYAPFDNLTRGMMMTIIARMEGIDTTGSEPWYQKGREWAMSTGVSDGNNPEKIIIRQEIVAMLYRYTKLKGYDVSIGETTTLDAFTDAGDLHEYAVPAMKWAVGTGIIIGTSETTLSPVNNVTRAQVAAIFARYYRYVLSK